MENSRQYSFINNENGFTISFINGQQLISELTTIHNIGPKAIEYYQKSVLSSLQMVNFLKPGESLGFYIDSEDPFYRFKIEIGQAGSYRTLLLPEDFEDFPTHLTGKCRIHKFMPNSQPYTSILEFENHALEDLVNEVIDKSYQTMSKVFVNTESNNCLMLTKLPPSNVDKKIEDFEDLSLEKIEKKYAPMLEKIQSANISGLKSIVSFFEKEDLHYIGSKEVKFNCPCSKERMIENLFTINKEDRESLFDPENSPAGSKKNAIETRCDYCNTVYEILKSDIVKDLH